MCDSDLSQPCTTLENEAHRSEISLYQRSYWRRKHRDTLCENNWSTGWYIHKGLGWDPIHEHSKGTRNDGSSQCSVIQLSFKLYVKLFLLFTSEVRNSSEPDFMLNCFTVHFRSSEPLGRHETNLLFSLIRNRLLFLILKIILRILF